MKLTARYVDKPWGRTNLPPTFKLQPGRKIGEIWFDTSGASPLLAKYLFTGERLSVQVHPDDEQARARGLERGKAECWYVIDAAAHATIGLGLCRALDREALRRAALDGSIVEALQWRPVATGDFFYVPPGTIHAIGGGISLLEVQQNSDVTYRLYDYGRARDLHLEDGLAVSRLSRYPDALSQRVDEGEDKRLVDGPQFIIDHSRSDRMGDRRRWVLPLDGTVRSSGDVAGAGECLLLEAGEELEADDGRMIIAAVA